MAAAYTADNLRTKQGNVGLESAAYKREWLQIKSGLWWRAYVIHSEIYRKHSKDSSTDKQIPKKFYKFIT